MSNRQHDFNEEVDYLNQTLNFIKDELNRQTKLLSDRKGTLKASRKDMWENTVHFSNDFDRLVEANQYLSEVNTQAATYSNTLKQIEKYKKMLVSPYFGRFDFVEEGSDAKEKIYIGLHNAMDPKTHQIYVYDWRAPISSIFYQYELGQASYKAPFDVINGEVLLKRQYKIQDSHLKYYFDCSVIIDDEILQEVLSQNSSPKMRNIVETIQREQDTIIRDTENELLIVQGIAGSGKTSIALHRIAFLLYNGLNANLNNQNILIISPNNIFSKYISSVLPDLREENVKQVTFDDYASNTLQDKGKVETRSQYLESLIASKSPNNLHSSEQSASFKGSVQFLQILDKLIRHYERYLINFTDVYYNNQTIESRQQLKNQFLDNKINLPTVKRLKRIENTLLDRIKPLQKKRLERIEKLVQQMDGHEFDIKSFSRLLLMKESKAFLRRLRKFTNIDYYSVYYTLFNEKRLLEKLADGLDLPDDLQKIISTTLENLDCRIIRYEDCAPLLYLKLKLEGNELFDDIKQVVIDEAQDYEPIHYKVFSLLFRDANFTVLGDIRQSIDKNADLSLYDTAATIFDKKKSVKISLDKSYRSTFEINGFTQKLLQQSQKVVSVGRHESKPELMGKVSIEGIESQIQQDVESYLKQGFESIAIICKTISEAEETYERLKDSVDVKLIHTSSDELEKGITIIPSYMAKGLEFDVVLVFNVSKDNYSSELDRRLLYIACTRALHRLKLYYIRKKSSFIQ